MPSADTLLANEATIRIALVIAVLAAMAVWEWALPRRSLEIVRNETNSNFGFNFPWWDRWLGTYRAQLAAGHQAMTIGIEQFRDPRELRLDRLLLQPLRGPASTYPVNRAPDA